MAFRIPLDRPLVALFLLVPGLALSQSTNAPLNEDYYHWIDRYEVKSGHIVPEIFTTIKPYKRQAIVAYVDSLKVKDGVFTSQSDQFNYDYLRNDSWEWSRAESATSRKPILKQLYKKKSDFLYVDQPDFDLHVNPVAYLGIGSDTRQTDALFINTRGIEVRGMIDRKVGFYTFLTDNQAILPSYVKDEMTVNPVLPHEAFWKTFKKSGVDFLQARAYIDFNISKHIYMQFGNDRTFIGNGYRSLIFSDYSPPHLYLRTNLKIWKLNYLFQLNRVTADAYGDVSSGSKPTVRYPTKYMAFHHLSINIGKKFNLGLFESVVFSPKDSLSQSTFELSYLNPVIFYRAIEQQTGSPDNVIIGADFKWNIVRHISFYGQLVVDEFVLDQFKSSSGWWANKFGNQLGLKYVDAVGISNLDLQVERNVVTPYTYSHDSPYGSYSNFRQPLGHPLGANFTEYVGIIRYQPIPKLNLVAKMFYTRIGRDTTGVNWGSDIMKNNQSRQSDYGNAVGQGVSNTVSFLDLTASFHWRHNIFIDVKQTFRNSSSSVKFYDTYTSVTSLALRLNIAKRSYDF